MKKYFFSFVNTPRSVAIVSSVVAVVIGIVVYVSVNRTPQYNLALVGPGVVSLENGVVGMQDLTLGFVSSGRIATVSVKAGDTVHTGQVLASLDSGNASGVLSQARAAYAMAQANYQKVINGATGSSIDVAKTALATARVALEQDTQQQKTLVDNAYRNLLNSTIVAENKDGATFVPPVISGAYTSATADTLTLVIYQTGSGGYFTFSGASTGSGVMSTVTPQPIGDTGLFVLFPSLSSYFGTSWTIQIPNIKAPNYLANYNAYQSALQTQTQVLAQAQASVDQAVAGLASVSSTARPEDVASAKAQLDNTSGALQIAQSMYANTIITSPGEGTVIAVMVSSGQNAVANAPAIELHAQTTEKQIALSVPATSVISDGLDSYVIKKIGNTFAKQKVVVGISDSKNVEIISGLVLGDYVINQ